MDKIMDMLFALAFTALVVCFGLISILLGNEVISILSGEVNECIRTK